MAGDILFQAKRAEASPFVWRCGQTPDLSELSFLIGFFEEMARQDGDAVEESFFDAVGLCELENERLRIYFANSDGFSAYDEQVALSGVDIFIEVDAKREEHIVGVERMAV